MDARDRFPAMVGKLSEVKLAQVQGRDNALPLRQFLIDFCACRETLTLKQGRLGWDEIGLSTSLAVNPQLNTWQACLQKHDYRMALPQFPLRGTKLDKQLTLAKRKGDCWAPFIAAMSEPALDIALSAGAPDRLIDLVSVVRSEGKPFFDEAFQHGRSIESRVASGHLEGSLGYGALAVGPLAGVSKMDIHKRWQTQPNVGSWE